MSATPISTLSAALQDLLGLSHQPQPSPPSLQTAFLAAQQTFQHQIRPLGEDIPAAQPILTEMNRTFRLTAMDIAFLQTARQPQTAGRRQHQLRQHLDQLLNFCQALSQVLTPDGPGEKA